jgi:hypothetical protein
VSRGSGPHLYTRKGFGVVTYLTALDPTSELWRAPALSHVPWLSMGHE